VYTLTTTVNGITKGNGTALSAATLGTDYSEGTSGLATGILKSTTGTGALSIAVAGTDYQAAGTYVTPTGTTTLTNKRWTARVGSTTSSATPTINTDNYDRYKLTALAVDITSMTTNLTGTPNDGDMLTFEITGTATHTITWGSSFAGSSYTLPTGVTGTATSNFIFQYSTTSSYGNNKWIYAGTY